MFDWIAVAQTTRSPDFTAKPDVEPYASVEALDGRQIPLGVRQNLDEALEGVLAPGTPCARKATSFANSASR